MKSEIGNPKLEILESCPCPLDHQIVEAVIAWAQTDPAMRDETWARVVDLLNRKTADMSGIAASATTEPSYAQNAPRSPMSTPGAVHSREEGTSPVCGGSRTGGGGLGDRSKRLACPKNVEGKEI